MSYKKQYYFKFPHLLLRRVLLNTTNVQPQHGLLKIIAYKISTKNLINWFPHYPDRFTGCASLYKLKYNLAHIRKIWAKEFFKKSK